jgi:hypothetical protein
VGLSALSDQQFGRRIGALAALLACAAAAAAQDVTIGKLEHFTDNRGWNEAGIGPTYQIVVTAEVVPSGFPTLAFGEQNGVREPLTLFTGDVYVLWKRFDPAFTGAWRIAAERSDAKGATATTAPIARPQQVPLVTDVRVAGKGAQPRLSWKLPSLAGFDVERIRVAVRGGARVQGRFLTELYVSGDLPPTATSFRIPAGVLKRGERYVFQVMLEDLEDGRLENRSLTFSDPYAFP